MISRIEAHNYRCFPKLAIDLVPRVLAGANGAGKTTLPDALDADFGKPTRVMSVKQCQDPAFNQLRDKLRAWFPEQK